MVAVPVLRILTVVLLNALTLPKHGVCQTELNDDSMTARVESPPLPPSFAEGERARLCPASTLCGLGSVVVPSDDDDDSPPQHCAEIESAEQLWDSLADPGIRDIHILQTVEVNTTALSASRGAINRTSSVRLLGGGRGVSLHFHPDEQQWPEGPGPWLELRAWLCLENLEAISGFLSTIGVRQQLSSADVLPMAHIVGVRLPEVEQMETYMPDFRAQGGYLTYSSGLLVMHSTIIVKYTVGHVFINAFTLKDWLRICKGVRPVMQLFPAWPVPAVMLPRGLLFTEGLVQDYRFVNATMIFEGNWPESEASELVKLPSSVSPKSECQTLTDGINGKDYAGDISTANDGSTCVPWAHIDLSNADFSEVEGNSCRNPADHYGVWCFTASPYPTDVNSTYVNEEFNHDLDGLLRQANGDRFLYSWKYCDVPQCETGTRGECQSAEDNGASYVGNVSVSENGKPCQLWNQTSLYDVGRPHSSCRNPSGYAQTSLRPNGVWCWTDVQKGDWESCDVPICDDKDEENAPSMRENASRGNFKAIIIAGCASAIALSVMAATAAYFAYKKHKLRRFTEYDSLKPCHVLERPRDSVTSVAIEPVHDFSVNQGARASSCEPQELGFVWTVSENSMEQLPSLEKMTSILSSSPAELGYVQLESQLGVGTFGKVWKCRWTPRGETVHHAACKIVEMKGLKPNMREQLTESVEAVYMKNTMTHPHVVRTIQVYKVLARDNASLFGPGYSRPEDGLELWIIQELCDMGDLATFCKKGQEVWGVQYYGIVLEILWEVMSALNFLHERGVVHADLKLDNILLQRSSSSAKGFVCKVGDFGVSHVMMGRDYYYSSSMSGEMRVLAPEVLRANKISTKMDTFSFGILMHDLLCTPTLGWERDSFPVVCTRTLMGERPKFPNETPEAYKALANACWSDDPDERPMDTDVLQRLQSMSVSALGLNFVGNRLPE